ncbi:hypothetical protein MIMGU_mgv1a016885mg [Erythranthe guttata]|uniref:Uncharacterized protein n=1 Tax=Erythranthe guttata TaxID=4155 RepID=A0A022QGJ7_ERYGU|nr:PREDICTED: uncharacterized protein LOC105969974 [Erythranthe guttata]EYU26719.1 hypothetical protein MIMGU_mgv1a016885mg [Erythranthe guttata]|eukprot:XP_012850200.1 PREDICTED: uncharacterized protein LOC105969974 [Erythranthe guttata]
MATTEEKIVEPNTADDGFTYADEVFVDGEMLVPDDDPVISPRVDPVSFTTSKQLKEEAEEEESKRESGKGDALHNLKSTIIISGVVVAVIGAVLAIARKIKQA